MPLGEIAARGIHTEYAGGSFTTSFVVRVVVLGKLGAAAARVGAVAVEFGFSEQARAGAGENAKRAVFQAGADGGDAEGESAVLVALRLFWGVDSRLSSVYLGRRFGH